MSHSVKVTLIADQEITLFGHEVNVHDIKTIVLNSDGVIVSFAVNTNSIDTKTLKAAEGES